MQSLKEVIVQAEAKKVAIGHFNVSDTEGLWAVFNATRSLQVPVIIGVSEGERDFIGVRQIAALVKSLREEFNYPIFLNADHTYSVERAKEAAEVGFDAVIIDGAEAGWEENISKTKEFVNWARANRPDLLVEGEIGYIGKSSKMLDELPTNIEENMVTPEQATEFVRATGVDILAPAVGNIHGMLKKHPNPKLDIERIRQIREATGVPLVLHGGSGISDDDFRAAIEAGISIIHINTEIRVAYRDAIKRTLTESPDEVAPYKFLKSGVQAMEEIAKKRLVLFNKLA